MSMIMTLLQRLMHATDGSMAIETAFVAPLLATLAVGGFEVGTLVSRHHELQTAASEAEVIVLAAAEGAEVQIATIRDIIATSLDVERTAVTITRKLRCNDDEDLVAPPNPCAEDDTISNYIRIEITETYDPVWTAFGVGGPVELAVDRTVQIS